MHAIRYVLVDVFTDRPLQGNQLAVFTDGRALDEGLMQALAREMNFSESVFLLPPSNRRTAQARIRIFTPSREIPFAGHPTLGAAFVVGTTVQLDELTLETGRGPVPLKLQRDGARVRFAWMSQPIPRVEPVPDEAGLLAALGVPGSALPVALYDNGVRHAYVALPSAEAVRAVRPDMAALARAGDMGVSTFAPLPDGQGWKTRMFAPSHGVPEDPATGSAAGPLAVHLLRHGRVRAGDEIRIEQGAELGRPSTLYAKVAGTAEAVERVEVGGAAVVIGRGELRLAG